MQAVRTRLIATGVVALLTVGSAGVASAQGVAAEPAIETLYISAGCPPSTHGTCSSTRWLGKTKGDAMSNFLTSITPVDEVFYRLDGSLHWRDYTSDDSLRAEGYPLRADQPLTQTVTIAAAVVAVNTTVHGRIDAVTASGQHVTFGPLEQTVTLLPGGRATVTFDFEIPQDLVGIALGSMTAWVAVHGINVESGHIDQRGGSTVKIPYWDAAATP